MPQNKLKRNVPANEIPGFPGYRTRSGRSGYDPLDTNREAAFMEGTFYKKLFTLRLRTRDPFHLTLMALFGCIISIMMGIALYALVVSPPFQPNNAGRVLLFALAGTIIGFPFATGIGLLVNFFLSLLSLRAGGKDNDSPARRKPTERKKLPKRRKDYQ